jgi:hypothetical protein
LVRQGLVKESELGAMAPPIYTLDVPQQQQVLAEVADIWELLHFDMHLCTSPLWGDYLAGKMSADTYSKVSLEVIADVTATVCFNGSG